MLTQTYLYPTGTTSSGRPSMSLYLRRKLEINSHSSPPPIPPSPPPPQKNSESQQSFLIAWENIRHFATPPVVYPRNDVWETSAEIPYWWRVTTQIWVVLLIGRIAREIWPWTSQWRGNSLKDQQAEQQHQLYELSSIAHGNYIKMINVIRFLALKRPWSLTTILIDSMARYWFSAHKSLICRLHLRYARVHYADQL